MKGFSFQRRGGFTLVEVLIVVSIIAILASLSMVAVQSIKRKAKATTAKTEIAGFRDAIARYRNDERRLPGAGRSKKKFSSDTNHFPELFLAIYDAPKPKGKGGRSAPYLDLDHERIVVEDEDYDEEDPEASRWKIATKQERRNSKVDKYYLDPFQQVYVYRCNLGQKERDWMMNPRTYDFYSVGEDGIDQTADGEHDEADSDDIK